MLLLLGIILFLNLIRLDTHELLSVFLKPSLLIKLTIIKLIVLPVIMYIVASIFYPRDALAILLLSGISTGLGAPFVTNLVGGRLALVVGTVISTSVSVPFVLPILVYIFFQSKVFSSRYRYDSASFGRFVYTLSSQGGLPRSTSLVLQKS